MQSHRKQSEPKFPYEVVNGDDFREVLKRYEIEWSVDRPREMKNLGHLSAYGAITENTDITYDMIDAIKKEGAQKRKWINVKTADTILTAIGLSHFLSDGTLSIVPNPQISEERYEAWRKERGCYD